MGHRDRRLLEAPLLSAVPDGSSMKGRKVPIARERQLYIDLLAPAVLSVVADAMDEALRERPREVWPASLGSDRPGKPADQKRFTNNITPFRVLVPLARLGTAQGYSGSSVFVAYFTDST